MELYTNESGPQRVRSAFLNPCDCKLEFAAPYFSYPDPILDLLKRGCEIDLLVTLSSATSPVALRRIIHEDRVTIRWRPNHAFHSKLYIFGSDYAVVGSANLTNSGLNENSEICVNIPGTDPAFSQLKALFKNYWSKGEVFTQTILERYESIFNSGAAAESSLDQRISQEFRAATSGLSGGNGSGSRLNADIERTIREYQDFHEGFGKLQKRYEQAGIRKNVDVPQHLEIDQFLSWIYDANNKRENWETPQPELVDLYLTEWRSADAPFLMQQVRPRLDALETCFASRAALNQRSPADFAEALWSCHSVSDRERHFQGGREGFNKQFCAENSDAQALRRKFDYLLWGEDNFVIRIARCAHNGPYKLHQLADRGVAELYGWINPDGAPIANQRARDTMHHLGFLEAPN